MTFEQATAKPIWAKRLVMAGCLYRSNEGTNATIQGDDLLPHFKQAYDIYEAAWNKLSTPQKIEVLDTYLAQVKEWLPQRSPDAIRSAILVLNMIFLVREGWVVSDEFNGTIFSWESR